MDAFILHAYVQEIEKIAALPVKTEASTVKKPESHNLRTAWRIIRDAGIVAGGVGAGYIGGGLAHKGLQRLGVRDPFPKIPPEKRVRALRAAAAIAGLGVSAAYLGVRAARSHHRNVERERDNQTRTG